MKTAGQPLVTYRLQCYRQEAYVEQAIRSLLAQTYQPLEILITDDASPDRTFEIATAVARGYRGPHRLVLRQSAGNRDILSHANEFLPDINGDFFIWMSGDDLAEPDQAERLVAAWLGGGVSAVWSNHRYVDGAGRDEGLVLPAGQSCPLNLTDYADGRFLDFPYSGTVGYGREVLDRFGAVPDDLGARGLEHHFGFRAAVLGPKRYLDTALFKRRRHPQRATAGENAVDRAADPLAVHERQIRVRLQVLLGCRDVIADRHGLARDPRHDATARGLTTQLSHEVRRLLELEAFRQRRGRAADPDAAEFDHSGHRYPPNGVTFVRALETSHYNVVAAECRYFALPWHLGRIEPCHLRNHRYPGVLDAWTETELSRIVEEADQSRSGGGADRQ